MAAKLRKFNFNMVEIAVAIAVVAFGIAAIMGVFPTILKQGKRASESDKTADVVSLVKAFVDAEYSAATPQNRPVFDASGNPVIDPNTGLQQLTTINAWQSFYDLFRDSHTDNGTPDEKNKVIDIERADQFAPIIFENADGAAMIHEDELFYAPFRVSYYKGIYNASNSVVENSNKQLLASYDVSVWKEPIANLNINGNFLEEGVDYNGYAPGLTVVIRVASPAGVDEELQEVSYYKFDYMRK
ncbi:MAG: hypothetical protein IKD09_05355 [Lentisphaeria bacterium]|nr:hypothetical protein [Lentisphaeria bacterium]